MTPSHKIEYALFCNEGAGEHGSVHWQQSEYSETCL